MAGDNSFINVSWIASFIHFDDPTKQKFSGMAVAPQLLGAGQWLIKPAQSLPAGQYGACFANLSGAAAVEFQLQDLGDPAQQILQITVGGVAGAPNGFSMLIYRIQPPL